MIGPNDPMPVHKTPNPRDVLDERVAIVPPQIKSKVNFLVATIYKAEGLPEMDMNHTCDPYVQVRGEGGGTSCLLLSWVCCSCCKHDVPCVVVCVVLSWVCCSGGCCSVICSVLL